MEKQDLLEMKITPELLARQTPLGFLAYTSGWRGTEHDVPSNHYKGEIWRWTKHHDFLNLEVLRMLRGDYKRLALAWPCGAGKSTFTSQALPAWLVCQYPHWKGLLITHSATFSEYWGRKSRDLVKDFGPPIFGVNVRKDMERVDDWETPQGGGMTSTGSQGGTIGRRCNWAIIDDPYGSWEDAQSEVVRESVWNFVTGTLTSRLEPGAFVLMSMARWHPRDIMGRLIEEMGQYWKVIRLPALAEKDDPLGREEGEPLDPKRFDVKELEAQRHQMTEFKFMAQYQQRPILPGGAMVKTDWIRKFRTIPEGLERVIASWDMAFMKSETSDYVAGAIIGQKGANAYILDMVNRRMDFVETAKSVKDMAAKWPQALAKLVEKRANGPAIMAYLQNEVPGMIPIEATRRTGDHEARMQGVLPLFEGGNVHVMEGQPWTEQFLAQLTAFPHADHDDMVDAVSQGLAWLYPSLREAAPEELPEEAQPCGGRTLEAYRIHAARAGMGQNKTPKWAWWT